jgi:hypothetical protein
VVSVSGTLNLSRMFPDLVGCSCTRSASWAAAHDFKSVAAPIALCDDYVAHEASISTVIWHDFVDNSMETHLIQRMANPRQLDSLSHRTHTPPSKPPSSMLAELLKPAFTGRDFWIPERYLP